ncbi:MAG: BatA domain-containing protein [Phycisphaerales bacterium]|nr:BatA domain-containing protein [Phycisphaerales bacterium]
MNFTHPALFAAGAACVAIPIIVHLLLRRRRKPVLWGAMRFILEAHKRTRRRLRLERWLLLAARCLLVLLVGAALARPLLSGAAGSLGAPGSRTVYILIDNALASGALDAGAGGDDATALARHKRSAARVLDALTPADRAALIALGAPALPLVAPPSADRAAVRTMLEGLQPTDGGADFAGALDVVARELAGASGAGVGSVSVVILSDFLLGSADLVRALPRVEAPRGAPPVRALASRPVESAPGNVQVLSVDPLRAVSLTGADAPLAGEQVRVQLRRTGAAAGEAATTTVRLSVMGASTGAPVPAGTAMVRWTPGQTEAVATATIDPASAGPLGEFAAVIAEIDADAIGADNLFRRPVGVRESLRVAVVDRRRFGGGSRLDRMTPGEWMRLALRPNDASPIEVTDVPPAAIDAAALAAVDVVYVPRPDLVDEAAWARLRAFAFGGGLVIVTPPTEGSVHLWSDGMARALGLDWRLARESVEVAGGRRLSETQPSNLFALLGSEWSELSRTVEVARVLPVEESGPETRTMLALDDGSAWMIAARPGSGGAGDAVEDAQGAGLVVYLASAPTLTWTSLPAKPLMLPLMQELVRQGAGQSVGALAHVAGGRLIAPPRATELTPLSETRRQTTGAERAPAMVDSTGRVTEPVRFAGLFRATDDRGATRGLVAVNADAGAGRTETQSGASVQQWLAQALPSDSGAPADPSRVQWIDEQSLAGALQTTEEGSPFSLPLLIAAACVALLETVMARAFSHARAEAPAPAGRTVAEALEAAA